MKNMVAMGSLVYDIGHSIGISHGIGISLVHGIGIGPAMQNLSFLA